MLYVSRSAPVRRARTVRVWLAVSYAVAAVLMLVLMVVACQAQADRIEEAVNGAVTTGA